jgi:magnesium transporter
MATAPMPLTGSGPTPGTVTAFAGIWGMNFKAMPELQWEYGYPMALGIIVSVCTLLFLRFRRMGWL